MVRRLMRNFNTDFWDGVEIPKINRFLADTSQEETSQGLLSFKCYQEYFFFPVEGGTCLWEIRRGSGCVFESGYQFHHQKINGTKKRGRKPCSVVSSCLCGGVQN